MRYEQRRSTNFSETLLLSTVVILCPIPSNVLDRLHASVSYIIISQMAHVFHPDTPMKLKKKIKCRASDSII